MCETNHKQVVIPEDATSLLALDGWVVSERRKLRFESTSLDTASVDDLHEVRREAQT